MYRLQHPTCPWTTNGVETLHKTVKYKYLSRYSDGTISGSFSAMVNRYLPGMWSKYVFWFK